MNIVSACFRQSFLSLALPILCGAIFAIDPAALCRAEDGIASLEELKAKWETQRSSIKTARLSLRYLVVMACKLTDEKAEEAVQKWRAGIAAGQKQESLEKDVLRVLGTECPSKWETLEKSEFWIDAPAGITVVDHRHPTQAITFRTEKETKDLAATINELSPLNR